MPPRRRAKRGKRGKRRKGAHTQSSAGESSTDGAPPLGSRSGSGEKDGGWEYQLCDGRQEVCRIWTLLTLKEKRHVLTLEVGDLERQLERRGLELRNKMLINSGKIAENPKMITAIRYLFCTMIENCEGVDSNAILKELHSPVVFFVFKVFEDRLLQIYVDRSSRAKMQLFSFMLLWMWTRLLWMRIVGAIVLMYLMTWKVISVGLVGGITHSCLLRSSDAPALAEAKIMGFLSGYVCIELGAWLSWYFALKAIALTPLLLVLLEGSLGEVSGLSGARWAALTLTQLLSIYLSYYSLPFFIVTSAIFAPFLATKAMLVVLIVTDAALYALGVVQSCLHLEIMQTGTRTLLLCCGVCFLLYTAHGSSNVRLGLNLFIVALLLPQSLLLLAGAGVSFLSRLFRHQTPDILMLSHLADFAFRYAFYRVSGHVPGTPSCVRRIARRLCCRGIRVGRFERFEDDDDENEDWYDGGDDC